jgi:double-stranded uracil-DNA glycosylase
MKVLLSDVLRPGLRVVFCGTALGTRSAEVRAYYAGPGNAFWETLHVVGLTPRRLRPEEYRELLSFDIGLTDVCKTRSGSDRAVGAGAFDVPRLLAQLEHHSPGWIAFNGKNAARVALGRPVEYGPQEQQLGGTNVYVLPSTSGAARRYWDLGEWQRLARTI